MLDHVARGQADFNLGAKLFGLFRFCLEFIFFML